MSDRNLNINIRTTADTSGADQTTEAINKTREAAQEAGGSADAINQVTDALNNVKTAAEETGAAMKDGMGAEYEQALENANSKLDQYADALTAAGSRMKAAFNDNPGLTGFIDEVTNAVLTSEEFRKKLEQVDDVFEVLNNKMSDLDLGAKWGDDLDENLQQIIDGYNKEIDAADKAAEKAEAAEARKQQAAAATVERLEANNRRASATYEELQAELESYIAKLEEARKAGDNVAQADALKNIQDLGRRIKTAGDAGQLTSTQVKGLAGQITIAATRILGMSSALRGAIPFIRLFGTTVKTAMGPLGWAMLLIQGLTAGITALIDHFKAKSDELDKAAEKAKRKHDEINQYLRDAEKGRLALVQKTKQEEAAHVINREYEQHIKNITYEYEKQTREIERQLALKKREIAGKLGIDTARNEYQRLEIEEQYQDGKISRHEKDYKLLILSQELDRMIEQSKLKIAQAEYLALSDKQGLAEEKRNNAWREKDRLQDVKMSLPSIDEMGGLFREQSNAQRRVQQLVKQLEEAKKPISWGVTESVETRGEKVKKQVEDIKRLEEFVSKAQKDVDIISSRISKIKERIEEEKIYFNPSYGVDKKGNPITDEQRTEEYKTAFKHLDDRQEELNKKLSEYFVSIEKVSENIGDKEEEIENLNKLFSIYERNRIKASKVGEKEWKNEEKKDAEKEQKKLEKERKRELKKLQQEQKREIDKAIKTFVEGFTINAGKSATPHQTSLVHKAIDGIRKDIERAAADGHIDEAEMRELGKLYVAKLQELGLATKRAVNGLKEELTQGLKEINAQIDAIGKWANTTQRQKRPGGIVNLPYRKR